MKRLIVDYSETLVRIATLDDEKLVDIHALHALQDTMQGRIVVGQVAQIVKNLNAVFIDYGAPKKGLLHLKQLPDIYKEKLHVGMRIPIQIKKENSGDKGHKLTGKLTLQGKYLVCLLYEPELCFSKKIKDPEFKKTLKEHLSQKAIGNFGFLVRTQAESRAIEDILKEANYLVDQATKIMRAKDNVSKGTILHAEKTIVEEVLEHEAFEEDTYEVHCNAPHISDDIEHFIDRYYGTAHRVTYHRYPVDENLFSVFNLEKSFEQLLKKKIWLKNGGNIVIEYTEALTVVDVNSAKAVIGKNASKAVLQLNELAIEEVFIQAKLRNLGGMIIVDLVELPQEKSYSQLDRFVNTLIANSKDSIKALPITQLGLLQLVRTKKQLSVPELLLETCNVCQQARKTPHPILALHRLELKIKAIKQQTIQRTCYVALGTGLADYFKQLDLDQRFLSQYGITLIHHVEPKIKTTDFEIFYHKRM